MRQIETEVPALGGLVLAGDLAPAAACLLDVETCVRCDLGPVPLRGWVRCVCAVAWAPRR